jgi:DNA helicase-2/ATP-dependent DNA helicase PcrA
VSGHVLNEPQAKAVSYDSGPLIVLAGPGTGKTNVIVRRVRHMIEERGIDPGRIVALTFTNEAARELRERLATLVGGSAADRLHASTFHSFGLSILRRFSDLSGLPARFGLLDSAQHRRLAREMISTNGLFRGSIARGISSLIDESRTIMAELRNSALEPAACRERLETLLAATGLEEGQRESLERFGEHVRLYELMDAAQRERGLLSVDELLTRPIGLLREHRVVREICQYDYHHVVVDEFQDLNVAQMKMLSQLCPSSRERLDLCVVGDDDQAIYAFRGANELAFEHFKRRWPNAETIYLETNYRSAPCVTAVANEVIGQSLTRFAPDKVIEASRDAQDGDAVQVVRVGSDFDSDGLIAAMLLTARALDPQRPWSASAVIGRTNKEIERIAAALRLEDIPVRMRSTRSPLDDEGVQDLLAWVRAVLEPQATWAVRRLLLRPPQGLGASRVSGWERSHAAAMSRVAPWAVEPFLPWLLKNLEDDQASRAVVERVARQVETLRVSATTESADVTVERIVIEAGLVGADLVGGRSRTDRIEALVCVLRFVRDRLSRLEAPGDLAAFWSYYNDLDASEQAFVATIDARVDGGSDRSGSDDDGVVLLTAHSAKGLEFDTVYVPRVSPPFGYPLTNRKRDRVLPDGFEAEQSAGAVLEEERRLFYVACTRAQKRLVLLGKVPKGKPGPTNLLWPVIVSGLASDLEPLRVLELAAQAGVSKASWAAEQAVSPEALGRMERETVVSLARGRLRHEASLALDAVDRSGLNRDALAHSAERLASVAARLSLLAAVASGQTDVAFDAFGDEAAAYGRALAKRLAQVDEIRAAGMVLVPPRPPLHLSYTMLRDYDRCPRCFYLRHVMKLSQHESSAIQVGKVTHAALEAFYRRWMLAEAEGRAVPGIDDLLALGSQIFDASVPHTEIVDEAQRDQVLAALATAHARLHDAGVEPIEVEKDVSFPFEHDGQVHRVWAKLDRVDRIEGGLRIVDYKTGHATKTLLEPTKRDLQMGIYALALRHVYGEESMHGWAEYWVLSAGERGVIAIENIDLEAIEKTVREAIDGILAGNFARNAGTCSGECGLLDSVVRDGAE